MNANSDVFLRKALELAGDFHPVDCPTEEDWEFLEREIGVTLSAEALRTYYLENGVVGDLPNR